VIAGGLFAPLGATKVNAFGRLAVFPPEVTLTSLAPGVVRAPVTAVIDVLPDTTTPVAGTPPTVTVASLANPLPEIVMLLPPVVLPIAGDIEMTFGVVLVGPDGESDPQAANTIGVAAQSVSASARRRRVNVITGQYKW